MQVRPRDRFAAEVQLTPATVSAFAHNVGDVNPVHHDSDYAATTRYQRLIASGAHTTGLLMGLTASHFSQDAAMVGLEFWFRFQRPIFADETIRLEWLVIGVRPNARLGGDIVDLRGRIRNQVGETAVGAKGRVLVAERL
jgi:3-hydroxybutyryl-CoA dehydratase